MLKYVLAGLGIGVVGFLAVSYFGQDHQRYLAWVAQRDAWHRKCDLYVGKTAVELAEHFQEATACKTELEAMMAYAATQGWK